jgi:hypothetical protein
MSGKDYWLILDILRYLVESQYADNKISDEISQVPDLKTTLETSGEDVKIHSKRVENSTY